MIKECKRCGSKALFDSENYETYNDLLDKIEVYDVQMCASCGCAHWDGKYEFPARKELAGNEAGGYATNESMAYEKSK